MRVGEIRQFYRVRDDGQRLMRAAMAQLNLAGSEEIQSVHLAKALQYRPKLIG